MNHIFVSLILAASLTANSSSIGQITGEAKSFGFTSDGYYCKANLEYQWIYRGKDYDFFVRVEDNVTGFIGTRLALLFFEEVTSISGLELTKLTDEAQIDYITEMALRLKKKVNSEMRELEHFELYSLELVTITIEEVFETRIELSR